MSLLNDKNIIFIKAKRHSQKKMPFIYVYMYLITYSYHHQLELLDRLHSLTYQMQGM